MRGIPTTIIPCMCIQECMACIVNSCPPFLLPPTAMAAPSLPFSRKPFFWVKSCGQAVLLAGRTCCRKHRWSYYECIACFKCAVNVIHVIFDRAFFCFLADSAICAGLYIELWEQDLFASYPRSLIIRRTISSSFSLFPPAVGLPDMQVIFMLITLIFKRLITPKRWRREWQTSLSSG